MKLIPLFEASEVTIQEIAVSGILTKGGAGQLAIENTALNHPIKPIESAGTFFRALEEDGREYVVKIALKFGDPGRMGLSDKLADLAQLTSSATGSDRIEVVATFGPSHGEGRR